MPAAQAILCTARTLRVFFLFCVCVRGVLRSLSLSPPGGRVPLVHYPDCRLPREKARAFAFLPAVSAPQPPGHPFANILFTNKIYRACNFGCRAKLLPWPIACALLMVSYIHGHVPKQANKGY